MVTGTLKAACDAIVHDGLHWDQAAVQGRFERPHNAVGDEKAICIEVPSPRAAGVACQLRCAEPPEARATEGSRRKSSGCGSCCCDGRTMHDSPGARGGSDEPVQPGLVIQIITRGEATTVGPVIENDDRDDE